jgi:hypothetical protein
MAAKGGFQIESRAASKVTLPIGWIYLVKRQASQGLKFKGSLAANSSVVLDKPSQF